MAGVNVESEVQRSGGAQPVARQLHFATECSDEGFEKVKHSLANALTSFHVEAERYAQAAEGLRAGPPKAQSYPNAFRAQAWDPATGKYSEEEVPADIQALMSNSQQESRGSKRGGYEGSRWEVAEPASKASRGQEVDPERAAKIARGEAMVAEGRRLARDGQLKDAHKSFQKGLKQLMSCMPPGAEDADDLPEHDKAFLKKIDDYLSEIEELDKRIKNEKAQKRRGAVD